MRDAAASDVVGTALLLGVTVALVAAAAPALLPDETAPPDPPRLAYRVEARAGEASLALRHLGGDAWPADDLRVVVASGGARLHDAPLGGGGLWRVGETRAVALAEPLPAGRRIETTLVAVAAGHALPPVAFEAPGAPPSTSGAGEVMVRFANGVDYAVLNGLDALRLEATPLHPMGRKYVDSVRVNLSSLRGPSALDLHDDGTRGDAVAGDGRYAADFVTPATAPRGVHRLNVTALDLDGRRVEGYASMAVLDALASTPFVNVSNFVKAGWTFAKDPSANTLALRLKLQMTSANLTIDGVEYRLDKAILVYKPFRPGDPGTWTGVPQGCAPPMALFAWSGSIPKYDVDLDALEYYFRTEWRSAAGTLHVSNVEARPPAQYLILRALEVSGAVGHPWTSLTDCTATP